MNRVAVHPVLILLTGMSGSLCGDDRVAFFEQQIRPALVKHCYACHSQTAMTQGVLKGGLRLDSRATLLRGGESGPVVVPGKPTESLLVAAIRHESLEMPPTKKLDAALIRAVETWIAMGAVFPDDTSLSATTDHWSLQPVVDPEIPRLRDSDWPLTDIDRFVLDHMLRQRLQPTATTTRETLLRRVSFDLIGLPPTREAIEAFVNDGAPTAWERVIDRLLASKHYGERWGRHWLDVARYADTTANDGNFVMRYAWRYRNYVIDAFNRDLPFDQFIVEQIAGDRIDPDASPSEVLRRHLATGFLMLGPKGLAETDKEQLKMDIVDEQIDVTTRAFLGMSFSCARCHDHKFDPIPTKDYYALAGIFRGVAMLNGQNGPTSMWHEGKIAVRDNSQESGRATLWSQLQSHRDKITKLLDDVDDRQTQWETQLRSQLSPPRERIEGLLDPTELSGLLAWYSADSLDLAEDAAVKVWHNKLDIGGANFNDLALLGHGDFAPRFRKAGINGRPAVHFDSGKHYLATPSAIDFSGPQSYSVYLLLNPTKTRGTRHQAVLFGDPSQAGAGMIFEIDSADTPFPRLDLATGHSLDAFAGEIQFGAPQIWSARYQGQKLVDASVHVSGTVRKLTTDQRTADHRHGFKPDTLVLGGNVTPDCRLADGPEMDVSELLIFDRALSDAEERQIGAWLQTGYRLPGEYPDLLELVLHKPIAQRTESESRYLRKLFLERNDAAFRELVRQHDAVQNEIGQIGLNAEFISAMYAKEDGGRDLKIHRRGNRRTLGRMAPRQTPSLFPGEPPVAINSKASGRLALARWIASPTNRLTARVLVNRVWQHHFGTGLVVSGDNFGRIGGLPSNPQLLDYLACRFIEDGWSIKSLHKRILLSHVYQQASIADPAATARAVEIDPENRLLWKYPRRRLEAEVIRDSLLAASGTLDRDYLGGGELVMQLYDAGETVDRKLGLVSVANLYQIESFKSRRRTIYLPVIRNAQNEIVALFDAADANAVTTRRTESVVATQTSFMLNNPFVTKVSRHFAQRLLSLAEGDDTQRVQHGYWIALGRAATETETADSVAFVRTYLRKVAVAGIPEAEAQLHAWKSFCQFLFCLNEFIYVD